MTIFNIVKSEYLKSKNIRSFLIFLIYLIFSAVSLFVMSYINENLLKIKISDIGFFDFFVNYNLFVSVIFFGIYTIYHIGNDINKNIYAKQFICGIGKEFFVLHKIVHIFLSALLINLFEILKFILLKYFYSDTISLDSFEMYKITLSYFAYFNIIGIFSFFLISVFKNTLYSAIGLFVLYKTDQIVNMIETVKTGTKVSEYLPIRLAENMLTKYLFDTLQVTILIFYIAFFLFIIFFKFKRNEIVFKR